MAGSSLRGMAVNLVGKIAALRGGISAAAALMIGLGSVAAGGPGDPALAAPADVYDWPQFNFDPQHSGNNTQEKTITPANAGSLRRLFQVGLPSVADGAPALLTGVDTPNGTRDLLFLTTKAGHILALDAHTGAQLWAQQYPAGSCRINHGSDT